MSDAHKRLRALSDFDAGDLMGATLNVLQSAAVQWKSELGLRMLDRLESMLDVDVSALAQARVRLDGHDEFRTRRMAFAQQSLPWKAGFEHLRLSLAAENDAELRRWRWIARAYGHRVRRFIEGEQQRRAAAAIRKRLPDSRTLHDPLLTDLLPVHQERVDRSLMPGNILHGYERSEHLVMLDEPYQAWKKSLQAEGDRIETALLQQCGAHVIPQITRNRATLAHKVTALRHKRDEVERAAVLSHASETAKKMTTDLTTGLGLPPEATLASTLIVHGAAPSPDIRFTSAESAGASPTDAIA